MPENPCWSNHKEASVFHAGLVLIPFFILFLPIHSSYKFTPNTVTLKTVLAIKINTNPQNSLGAAPAYILNELRSNRLQSNGWEVNLKSVVKQGAKQNNQTPPLTVKITIYFFPDWFLSGQNLGENKHTLPTQPCSCYRIWIILNKGITESWWHMNPNQY